ncbi:MAG: hypothetical protein FWH41_04695 [Treponema sp.]|nr:hypothetical protein [Treponema sp.]
MDKIVLKYLSSKNEITEREISNVSSKITSNMNRVINAVCHLRHEVRSFNLDNVLEIKINNEIIDKEIFWKNNFNDKNNLIKNFDKMVKKKKKEYDEYVFFIESWKNSLNNKKNLLNDLDKMLKKKEKEYDEYVLFAESMKKTISEI